MNGMTPRVRASTKRSDKVSDGDPNNNTGSFNSDLLQTEFGFKPDKYSLRPRSSKRRLDEEDDIFTEEEVKPRSNRRRHRPPPLSKYRRKTANARERDRMREINTAFEVLRQIVPTANTESSSEPSSSAAGEKLTKITTLRLAMKYIKTLSEILNEHQEPSYAVGSSSSGTSSELGDFLSDCGDFDSLFLESDPESLHLREPLTPVTFNHHDITVPMSRLDSPELDQIFL